MYAVTKSIINKGILEYQIEKEEEIKGGLLVFLNENEKLDKCFFDRIMEVKKEFNCSIEINYSEKKDCIVLLII